MMLLLTHGGGMRTTITLDDELMKTAQEYTGVMERTAVIQLALKTLVELEAGRRLALLEGTMPDFPATEARGDDANGRKRKGWKEEITRAFEEASGDLKGATDREILDEIKLYRAQRRKSPEISVIAVPQEKTA